LYFCFFAHSFSLSLACSIAIPSAFLTSDFWSILFAVSLFHAHLNLLYFVAFGIIIIGLLIYNLAGIEGSVMDIVRELCSSTGSAAREEHDAEHDTTTLPTTHAHTRPMPTSDGWNPVDQDANGENEHLADSSLTHSEYQHQHG
jgi:hypothetical protein